jgi:hypothetical protein
MQKSTWCDNYPDLCKEDGLIYNLHNKSVVEILTVDTLFIAGITWLLCHNMSSWVFIIVFVLLLILNSFIHKYTIGMSTVTSRFFGI